VDQLKLSGTRSASSCPGEMGLTCVRAVRLRPWFDGLS